MMTANDDYLVEVIVCSVADAVAAAAGGAHRLEIISHFEVGGLTPPLDMVKEIIARVHLPVRVMLRESEDFCLTDEAEKRRLCEAARVFAALPVDGLVCGFLKRRDSGFAIDHELLARVAASAPHVRITFHRAFEELPDPLAAVAELKRHPQVDRILTSGGGTSLAQKISRLAACEHAARPEITLIAGGGMAASTIRVLRAGTLLREFHVGTAVRAGHSIEGPVEAAAVRELIRECFT